MLDAQLFFGRLGWWKRFLAGTPMAIFAVVPVSVALQGGRAAADVPTPTVSTPPAGFHGFPWFSEPRDLSAAPFRYVEEEFFIEGTARSYVPDGPLDGISDGRWDASPTGPTAPFKTRLLIRRPENPSRFNGMVLVEWANVSGGFGASGFNGAGGYSELLMRDGWAYVGVDAQFVGVFFLGLWDPLRYGSVFHPGDSHSYDIFSQAAQALLNPSPSGPAPLGDLTGRIRALVATGGSQSGARLFTYINSVHPTAGLFDGFNPTVATGGAPLSQPPLPLVPVPGGSARVIRTDSTTPVLWWNSESEFVSGARGMHLQPDGPRFRLWEIAGSAHQPVPVIESFVPTFDKMGFPPVVLVCPEIPGNDLEVRLTAKAALDAVRRWIETGDPPASAPRAQLDIPADPTEPATVVRDPATGLAEGGIRLPDVAAPIRTLTGLRPMGTSSGACSTLTGASDPWNGDSDPWDGTAIDISPTPEPNLSALYPNHGTYVEAVTHAVNELVDQGYLWQRDAAAIVIRAAQSDIP